MLFLQFWAAKKIKPKHCSDLSVSWEINAITFVQIATFFHVLGLHGKLVIVQNQKKTGFLYGKNMKDLHCSFYNFNESENISFHIFDAPLLNQCNHS